MSKDWTGTAKSIYTIMGASNHTDQERERAMTFMQQKARLLMHCWRKQSYHITFGSVRAVQDI